MPDVLYAPLYQSGFSSAYNMAWSLTPALPEGRAMLNGTKAIRITALQGYFSGRDAAATIQLSMGSAYTGSIWIPQGSPGSTGMVSCNSWDVSGGNATFRMHNPNQAYIDLGRSNTDVSYYGNNGNAAGTLSGQLAFGFRYGQAPSVPLNFNAVLGSAPGSVVVSFTNPAETGDFALTGFRVHYWLQGEPAYKRYVDVTSTPVTISNLDPGRTWNFAVSAKNGFTTNKGSVGPATATKSLFLPSGGKIREAGVWKPIMISVREGTSWKPVNVEIRDEGIWNDGQ